MAAFDEPTDETGDPSENCSSNLRHEGASPSRSDAVDQPSLTVIYRPIENIDWVAKANNVLAFIADIRTNSNLDPRKCNITEPNESDSDHLTHVLNAVAQFDPNEFQVQLKQLVAIVDMLRPYSDLCFWVRKLDEPNEKNAFRQVRRGIAHAPYDDVTQAAQMEKIRRFIEPWLGIVREDRSTWSPNDLMKHVSELNEKKKQQTRTMEPVKDEIPNNKQMVLITLRFLERMGEYKGFSGDSTQPDNDSRQDSDAVPYFIEYIRQSSRTFAGKCILLDSLGVNVDERVMSYVTSD